MSKLRYCCERRILVYIPPLQNCSGREDCFLHYFLQSITDSLPQGERNNSCFLFRSLPPQKENEQDEAYKGKEEPAEPLCISSRRGGASCWLRGTKSHRYGRRSWHKDIICVHAIQRFPEATSTFPGDTHPRFGFNTFFHRPRP